MTLEKLEIGALRVSFDEGVVEMPFFCQPLLAAWVPATDEADAPEFIPDTGFDSEIDAPAQPTELIVVDRVVSVGTELRVRGVFNASYTSEYVVTGYDDDDLPIAPRVMTVDSGKDYAYRDGYAAGDKLDVEQRFFDGDGNASQFSTAISTESVVYNNTQTSAPVMVAANVTYGSGSIVEDVTVTFTSPNDLRVSYVEIWAKIGTLGTPALQETLDVRPALNYTTGSMSLLPGTSETAFYYGYAYTSNGTQSAASNQVNVASPSGGA